MFRKTVNGDITDEDFKKVLIPFNDNYDEFLDEVVSKIEMPINSKFYLLDLGCGTGNLCKRIREKFPNAHIYALDFSEEMLNTNTISSPSYVFLSTHILSSEYASSKETSPLAIIGYWFLSLIVCFTKL